MLHYLLFISSGDVFEVLSILRVPLDVLPHERLLGLFDEIFFNSELEGHTHEFFLK